MSHLQPCVYVESLSDKLFAEAILRPYNVDIHEGMTTSGTIARAQFSLLEHPDRPVAVLLTEPTGDAREREQNRASVKRLLARAAPEGWYVGVAVPRLDAWAMTDPRIKQDFESYFQGRANYLDRARRFAEITRNQSFDPTELSRQSADFRGLIAFLKQHSPAPSR